MDTFLFKWEVYLSDSALERGLAPVETTAIMQLVREFCSKMFTRKMQFPTEWTASAVLDLIASLHELDNDIQDEVVNYRPLYSALSLFMTYLEEEQLLAVNQINDINELLEELLHPGAGPAESEIRIETPLLIAMYIANVDLNNPKTIVDYLTSTFDLAKEPVPHYNHPNVVPFLKKRPRH